MNAHDAPPPAWPLKQRELQNHHMDSTRWNGFAFRDGDIVIATWAKSGTTWMQQIVAQLIFDDADTVPIMDLAPWVDQRYAPIEKVRAMLEAQRHRRFMKTHLPVDALVFSPRARYLYIARDGRDALMSWYNHHQAYNDDAYAMINDTPGRVGPPLERPAADIARYFREWLDNDGYPAWPFFGNVRSWWEIRALPNVLLLHYNDLLADLEGQMRRVADFLGIDIAPAARWPAIVHRCTFDYMKANAERIAPHIRKRMDGGAARFIHKGTNGRWRAALPAADVARYERLAADELGASCAAWLAQGGPTD